MPRAKLKAATRAKRRVRMEVTSLKIGFVGGSLAGGKGLHKGIKGVRKPVDGRGGLTHKGRRMGS